MKIASKYKGYLETTQYFSLSFSLCLLLQRGVVDTVVIWVMFIVVDANLLLKFEVVTFVVVSRMERSTNISKMENEKCAMYQVLAFLYKAQ